MTITAIALLTGIMILATTTTVLLVTQVNVSRPVEDLVRSLREIGSGGARQVPVRHHDELGRLAEEFNVMCARLEASQASLRSEQERRARTERQLHRSERLAAVGRLAAGLAHEIGTPLNVIRGRAEPTKRRATQKPEYVARHIFHDDGGDGAAQSAKRLLVQLGPAPRARSET